MFTIIFILSCTSYKEVQNIETFDIKEKLSSVRPNWKEVQEKCNLQDREFLEKDAYWLTKKYKRQVYQSTSDPEVNFLYGRLLGFFNQEENALNQFFYSLKKDPEYIWSYYAIGIVYLKKKSYQQAQSFVEKSILLDSTFTPGVLALAKIKAYYDKEEALFILQEAEKHDTGNPIIKQNIANLLSQQHKYEQALQVYKETFALDSKNLDLLDDWSKLLLKLKKYKEALEILKKIYILMPSGSAKKEIAKTISLVTNLAYPDK